MALVGVPLASHRGIWYSDLVNIASKLPSGFCCKVFISTQGTLFLRRTPLCGQKGLDFVVAYEVFERCWGSLAYIFGQ